MFDMFLKAVKFCCGGLHFPFNKKGTSIVSSCKLPILISHWEGTLLKAIWTMLLVWDYEKTSQSMNDDKWCMITDQVLWTISDNVTHRVPGRSIMSWRSMTPKTRQWSSHQIVGSSSIELLELQLSPGVCPMCSERNYRTLSLNR
jgi:hypothetical protein